MTKGKSTKNILSAGICQALSIIAGLVLTRLILKNYGSATNGLINSVTQIFAYFILLEAGVGASSLQALYKPVAEDDAKGISAIMNATRNYYGRMSIVYALAVAAFAAAYPLLMQAQGKTDGISLITMSGAILIIGAGNLINFAYQGKYKLLMQAQGRNYIINNAQSLLTLTGCVLKCAGILLGFPIIYVLLLGFAANVLQTVYYICYIKKNYSWINRSEAPALITQKRSVMVHQVSQLIFQNTDVIILTVFCGLKVVSVYAAFKIVVSAISSLCYQISESVLYRLGQKYAEDRDGYCRDIDCFDVGYTMVSFALFATALVLYRPFIQLYTGGVTDISYDMAGLPLIFVAIELVSGVRRAMQNTINVAGHFRATVPRTITESVINIAVSLALVVPLGIYGVLIGTLAALLYRSNDIIIYGNKRILGRSAAGSYRIYLVNLAAFVPAVLLSIYTTFLFSGFGGFILAGLLVVIIMGGWFFLVNFIFFRKKLAGLINLRGEE